VVDCRRSHTPPPILVGANESRSPVPFSNAY
jgi:hypothetical protein